MADYVTHIAEIKPEDIQTLEARTFTIERCTQLNGKYYYGYKTPYKSRPEFMEQVARKIPSFKLFIFSEDTGSQVGEAIVTSPLNISDQIKWEQDFGESALKKNDIFRELDSQIYEATKLIPDYNQVENLGLEFYMQVSFTKNGNDLPEGSSERQLHNIYVSDNNEFYHKASYYDVDGNRSENQLVLLGDTDAVKKYISSLPIEENTKVAAYAYSAFHGDGQIFSKSEFESYLDEKLFCKELERELVKEIPNARIDSEPIRENENCISLPIDPGAAVHLVVSDLKTNPTFKVNASSMIDDIDFEDTLIKDKTSLKAVSIAKEYFNKVVEEKRYDFAILPSSAPTAHHGLNSDLTASDTAVFKMIQECQSGSVAVSEKLYYEMLHAVHPSLHNKHGFIYGEPVSGDKHYTFFRVNDHEGKPASYEAELLPIRVASAILKNEIVIIEEGAIEFIKLADYKSHQILVPMEERKNPYHSIFIKGNLELPQLAQKFISKCDSVPTAKAAIDSKILGEEFASKQDQSRFIDNSGHLAWQYFEELYKTNDNRFIKVVSDQQTFKQHIELTEKDALSWLFAINQYDHGLNHQDIVSKFYGVSEQNSKDRILLETSARRLASVHKEGLTASLYRTTQPSSSESLGISYFVISLPDNVHVPIRPEAAFCFVRAFAPNANISSLGDVMSPYWFAPETIKFVGDHIFEPIPADFNHYEKLGWKQLQKDEFDITGESMTLLGRVMDKKEDIDISTDLYKTPSGKYLLAEIDHSSKAVRDISSVSQIDAIKWLYSEFKQDESFSKVIGNVLDLPTGSEKKSAIDHRQFHEQEVHIKPNLFGVEDLAHSVNTPQQTKINHALNY